MESARVRKARANGKLGLSDYIKKVINERVDCGQYQSLRAVAQEAGVSASSLYYWMDGRRLISELHLNSLANFIGLKLEL